MWLFIFQSQLTCNIISVLDAYNMVIRHLHNLHSDHPIKLVPIRHHTEQLQYYWLCSPSCTSPRLFCGYQRLFLNLFPFFIQPVNPTHPWCPSICSLCLWVCFCFVCFSLLKNIPLWVKLYDFCPSLSDLFHLSQQPQSLYIANGNISSF